MDSKAGGEIPSSFHPHHHNHHDHGARRHHHRHVFYISPHCPLHRSILQPKKHSPSCSFSTSFPFPQNPELVASIPSDPHLSNIHPSEAFDDALMMQDETEDLELEEEGEPIFVLTDEWRDFFAKSEAKRRLAKKQAKKGKN